MTDDEEARAIAAGLTKAQWEALAESVSELIRLSAEFAGEGIALSGDNADDPAFHLCNMTSALDLDDWALLSDIVRAALMEMEGRG